MSAVIGHRSRFVVHVGLLVLGLAAVLAVLAPASAQAHVKSSTGYSVIRSDGGEVDWTLIVDYQLLARSSSMGGAAEDAVDDAQRRAALNDRFDVVHDYVAERVAIFLDDVACEGGLVDTDLETRDAVPHAVLDLRFTCPGTSTGSYRVHYAMFASNEGMIDGHLNLVEYDLGDVSGEAIFDWDVTDIVAGDRAAVASIVRFVTLGFEHILTGLDHVLFVVALMLGATSIRSLAKVVTMFTLAHSLTLGLAALGWVNLPADIVEPLIAVSIVYVAIDSLLAGRVRHRLAVVFAFGLLHGLGFASTLQFTDTLSWSLLGSLASFNVGIELGQAALVLLVFPVVLLSRRLPTIRRVPLATAVHVGATVVVAGLGLVWFAERVALV
ncbi:HupE/UreJ family protein [Nocardioides sp. LHG3406-4]|uniref:HupE/UreJ family protein n=1 Tax=Nocardioides sp. LHG3406-4 TaxID=2804575 RepID=UPI003CF719CB